MERPLTNKKATFFQHDGISAVSHRILSRRLYSNTFIFVKIHRTDMYRLAPVKLIYNGSVGMIGRHFFHFAGVLGYLYSWLIVHISLLFGGV